MRLARTLALLSTGVVAAGAAAQSFTCPDKNLNYWQAFPPGGESDISARHQQVVLKKKCPAIDTVVQYKAGGGGAILWSSANTLPADGLNVYGINLPHVVLQPLEGQVQYKTEDLVPVFWYHFTPDALVVPEQSAIKSFADFLKAAKADPGKLNLGGSALNSANHVAHERLNGGFGIKTTYVPYKGTGDLANAVLGAQIDGAMTYTVFAINNKQRVRALAVAMPQRHPLLPDVPTFKELGVDWSDGAIRGIGVPKDTPMAKRRQLSDLFAALNAEQEMKDLAAKSGFELINVPVEQMESYMKERTRVYGETGKRLGLGEKK
ncbi:MAG: tripartite tricarboxylate transporter substrate binding protein [Aquincola sp.]|nr:tripartite tricarboxylate transporter substrate binding protein [Aquincola sp.]